MYSITTLTLLAATMNVAASSSSSDLSPPPLTITVNKNITYQRIHGFGFSEAFQRAHSLVNLPEPYQSQVLDLLFSPTTGAGFSILRIGLGSSVNSTGDKMNSPQPHPDQPFTWDGKDSGQVWVARQAKNKYNVSMFYGDSWSAPGWMKTNGADYGGGWLCGVSGEGKDVELVHSAESGGGRTQCGEGESYVQAYGEYIAKYVQAYALEGGIEMSYVGFLNEPNLV